jgi:hypothetical protein
LAWPSSRARDHFGGGGSGGDDWNWFHHGTISPMPPKTAYAARSAGIRRPFRRPGRRQRHRGPVGDSRPVAGFRAEADVPVGCPDGRLAKNFWPNLTPAQLSNSSTSTSASWPASLEAKNPRMSRRMTANRSEFHLTGGCRKPKLVSPAGRDQPWGRSWRYPRKDRPLAHR